jgi:hypothetical protein
MALSMFSMNGQEDSSIGKEVNGGILSCYGKDPICSSVLIEECCWLPPRSKRGNLGHVKKKSEEGTMTVCIDGLPGEITSWSCLVNMGAKVPIRVLNVRNEKVHLVVGTRQGKVCETGDAVAVLPTCQKPDTVHVHQVFCQTAIENILAHLT